MNLPCVFLWIAGLWFTAFTQKGKPYRFAAWAYVFVIVLLMVLHGKNYYSIGVYPVLFAFGVFSSGTIYLAAEKIFALCFCAHHFYYGTSADTCCFTRAAPEKLANYYG